MARAPSLARRGSSLIEALIAAGLLAVVLTGLLPLTTIVISTEAMARADVMAAHLARQRLAQVRTLEQIRTTAGVTIDLQSRMVADGFASGGPGLSATGLAPLQDAVDGWADWLDARGAWMADGASAPPGARYRRVWGILTGGADGCLRTWVEVTPLNAGAGDHASHAGALHCAWGAALP